MYIYGPPRWLHPIRNRGSGRLRHVQNFTLIIPIHPAEMSEGCLLTCYGDMYITHMYIADVLAEQLVEQDTTQTTIINSIVAVDTLVLHLVAAVSLYHHVQFCSCSSCFAISLAVLS